MISGAALRHASRATSPNASIRLGHDHGQRPGHGVRDGLGGIHPRSSTRASSPSEAIERLERFAFRPVAADDEPDGRVEVRCRESADEQVEALHPPEPPRREEVRLPPRSGAAPTTLRSTPLGMTVPPLEPVVRLQVVEHDASWAL